MFPNGAFPILLRSVIQTRPDAGIIDLTSSLIQHHSFWKEEEEEKNEEMKKKATSVTNLHSSPSLAMY